MVAWVEGAEMLLAHDTLKRVVTTEKSTFLTEKHNCYVFEVASAATKGDIAAAVESVWGVRVVGVRTQSRAPRSKRFRNHQGFTRQAKVAIVALHPDDRLVLS